MEDRFLAIIPTTQSWQTIMASIDPYKVSPPCRYDHRALVAYAEQVGKSINDLSLEEKAQFIER